MIKTGLQLLLVLSATAVVAQTEIYNESFQSGLPVSYTIVDNDGFTPEELKSMCSASALDLMTNGELRSAVIMLANALRKRP